MEHFPFSLLLRVETEHEHHVCTLRFVVEEVVVLRDVCDDTQPVGHSHGHHVLWVEQGWDPQLALCHFKCLKRCKEKEKE